MCLSDHLIVDCVKYDCLWWIQWYHQMLQVGCLSVRRSPCTGHLFGHSPHFFHQEFFGRYGTVSSGYCALERDFLFYGEQFCNSLRMSFEESHKKCQKCSNFLVKLLLWFWCEYAYFVPNLECRCCSISVISLLGIHWALL